MKATEWEFKNRALVFGMMFAVAFPLYFFDPQNATAALAAGIATLLHANADHIARILFFLAALAVSASALVRTWASAYLRSEVVYAADLKTASLVADGPYRRVRNPLYLGNALMAVGMGAMTSRIGFIVLVLLMVLFNYRLIFREESELAAARGVNYEQYRNAVPRLWPSVWPRIPSAGSQANWASGFKVESWYWGFALALWVFAITLKILPFFIILGASIACLFLVARSQKKKDQP